MQSTAGTAAGGNGEIFFALFQGFLFIGAGNRVLETGRVGRVSGDGNMYPFVMHDGNAFLHVVAAVAVNSSSFAV
jgi:hypothetical protein